MTLVIGWKCTDGLVLVAEDVAVRDGEYGSQKKSGVPKIKSVGLNCAVGVEGNGFAGWATLGDVAARYSSSIYISAPQIADEIRQRANEVNTKEGNLSWLVAGFQNTADGKQQYLAAVRKNSPNDQIFTIDPSFMESYYLGITYICHFLDQYLPIWHKLTMEEAQRAASILIAITGKDAAFPLGPVSAVAKVTEQSSTLIEGKVLQQLQELGQKLQNRWGQALKELVLGVADPTQ